MKGSQIAFTTKFKYLLLEMKKYSLFDKLMKENILPLVFAPPSHILFPKQKNTLICQKYQVSVDGSFVS